ncbi:hypothetical protein [Pseudorhodobacter ferrugineus]|uniref:hypothetical protein n=1 Tax=Pseudorhodobacter ferrugineus TaxID=77008 RepID=UPI0003B59A0C|nr:hypothetical protein [Pseudorhodobacter ferrugineus]
MSDSWLVEFWSRVFGILGKLSVFSVLRAVFGAKVSYGFVEAYVLFHTALALLTLVVASINIAEPVTLLLKGLVIYGGFRVLETVIYQINVLLFDQYRAFKSGIPYKVRSFRRLVILLLHNYFEMLCWFGVTYTFFYRSGDVVLPSSDLGFFAIFRESLLMMISFTPETSQAKSALGMVVLTVHSFVGIFMTVMVLARFLALLPPPESHDEMDKR